MNIHPILSAIFTSLSETQILRIKTFDKPYVNISIDYWSQEVLQVGIRMRDEDRYDCIAIPTEDAREIIKQLNL